MASLLFCRRRLLIANIKLTFVPVSMAYTCVLLVRIFPRTANQIMAHANLIPTRSGNTFKFREV